MRKFIEGQKYWRVELQDDTYDDHRVYSLFVEQEEILEVDGGVIWDVYGDEVDPGQLFYTEAEAWEAASKIVEKKMQETKP